LACLVLMMSAVQLLSLWHHGEYRAAFLQEAKAESSSSHRIGSGT